MLPLLCTTTAPQQVVDAVAIAAAAAEIHVFSKAEETDFCLAALLVGRQVARYYNSILSCYLVIRVGK